MDAVEVGGDDIGRAPQFGDGAHKSPSPAAVLRSSARSVAMGAAGFALFTLSGACGLAYEVLWARWLGLFVGNTVLLHMTVLGTFMAGLACGSFWLGRRMHRVAAAMRVYATLELAIAAYALLFPLLAGMARELELHGAAARVFVSIALLILPALLMGGTYPALTAWYEGAADDGPRAASGLYAANCLGAAAGALATGIVLIPSLGLTATCVSIAVANGLIGLCALLLAARTDRAVARPAVAVADPLVAPSATASDHRIALAAVALSGGAAFLYELVWTRLFTLTLGNSTYSFTLMLAAFLSGLAIGSMAVAAFPRVRSVPFAWFAAAEAAIAVAVAISIPLYPRMPYWSWRTRWLLRPVEASFGLYEMMQFGLTFAVMFVPTLLFGITVPTAVCAVARTRSASEAAATTYGWNTTGTLLGVAAAGLALIPLVGLQWTLALGAALNAAIALLLGFGTAEAARLRAPLAAAAVVVCVFLAVSSSWNPLVFSQGTFRSQVEPPADWAAFLATLGSHRVLFSEEDYGTTVDVLRGPDADGTDALTLVVDGKTDASSYGDMPTQILLGQIPLFLRPASKRVFVLGLGSGVTAGSVLTHPVERVDCAELSRGVEDALPYFDEANGAVRRDPRFHLDIEDGKTALPAMGASVGGYDVIISEPPNPWVAGVGNLFSADFYRVAARNLRPNGIMAQWFHTYEFDDRLVSDVVATFRTVFPHALLFNSGGRDYILVGSREAIAPDFAAMQRAIDTAEIARDLDRIHLANVAAVLSRQSHGERATFDLGLGGVVNTDDRPTLEFRAPRAQYASSAAHAIVQTDERIGDGAGLLLAAYRQGRQWKRADLDAVLNSLSDSRLADGALERSILSACLARWPKDDRYLWRMASTLARSGDLEQAKLYLERGAAVGDTRARDALARIGTQESGGGRAWK